MTDYFQKMYGASKEEHFKLVTSKDLMTDREVQEEMLELNMPRTFFFANNTLKRVVSQS